MIEEGELLNFQIGDIIIFIKDTEIEFKNWSKTDYKSVLKFQMNTVINNQDIKLMGTQTTFNTNDTIKFIDMSMVKFITASQIRFKKSAMIIIENNTIYGFNTYGKSLEEAGTLIEFDEPTVIAFGKDMAISFEVDNIIKFMQETDIHPNSIKDDPLSYEKNEKVEFKKGQRLSLAQFGLVKFYANTKISTEQKSHIINLNKSTKYQKQIIKGSTFEYQINSSLYLMKDTVLIHKSFTTMKIHKNLYFERDKVFGIDPDSFAARDYDLVKSKF